MQRSWSELQAKETAARLWEGADYVSIENAY